MSTRALVAVPVERGTNIQEYDVYHSHNGGFEFKLYPYLNNYNTDTLKRLQKLPFQLSGEVEAENDDNVALTDTPIISEDPIIESVTFEEIQDMIDFVFYDVLYLVDFQRAQVFYLNYSGMIMHSILHETAAIDFYPPNIETNDIFGDTEPLYRVEKKAYQDLSRAIPVSPRGLDTDMIESVLKTRHKRILTSLYTHDFDTKSEAKSLIQAEMYMDIHYTVADAIKEVIESMPDAGHGVLIPATPKRAEPADKFSDIRVRASALRWEYTKPWVRQLEVTGKPTPFRKMFSQFIELNERQFGDVIPTKDPNDIPQVRQ